MRLWGVCVLVGVVACASLASGQTQKSDLLDRLDVYITKFVDGLSNVVAEERYSQASTSPTRRRTLRSDYVFIRYPGTTAWHAFRDVFEVDGKAIRDDREDRLAKLFLRPPGESLNRAQQIAQASTQHNVHEVGSVNQPVLAMALLQREYRDRFHFDVGRVDRKMGPTVRVLRFEEFKIPTFLRQGPNLDLPIDGLAWIDETTGRILKTELRLGEREAVGGSFRRGASFPTTVITRFGFDEGLGADVPVEMRDRYPMGRLEIEGTATYSRFRRFQVYGAGNAP
jgi:hypothetical protein